MALERETLDFLEGDGITITLTDIDDDTVGIEITADDAGSEAALAAHLGDAVDAHDASAISVLDTAANFVATEVEGVLAEIAATPPASDRDMRLFAFMVGG